MRLEGWGGHMVRDAALRAAPHHEAELIIRMRYEAARGKDSLGFQFWDLGKNWVPCLQTKPCQPREVKDVVTAQEKVVNLRTSKDCNCSVPNPQEFSGLLQRESCRVPKQCMTEFLSRRDRLDLSGSNQPPPSWRIFLVLMGVASMNDEIDPVEGIREKLLIRPDHECRRHDASRISQHSVIRNDGKAFNAKRHCNGRAL